MVEALELCLSPCFPYHRMNDPLLQCFGEQKQCRGQNFLREESTERVLQVTKEGSELGFPESQDNNTSEPPQKDDIHQESFHSYLYRRLGFLG